MAFPAASVAAPARTETVTAPSPVGVTSNVNVVVSTAVTVPTVPFSTDTPLAANPVTASLNVAVNVIGADRVGLVAVVMTATDGATESVPEEDAAPTGRPANPGALSSASVVALNAFIWPDWPVPSTVTRSGVPSPSGS